MVTTEPSPASTIAATTTSALPPTGEPPSKYIKFDHLSSEDGLSNDQVRGIVQDNYGFIWITTNDGLNRYDGSSLKVYRHNPDDPYSLSSNIVRSPIVDQSGLLWLGTYGGGLNQYDPEEDVFIRYQHDPNNPRSLSNDNIRAVYEDPAGTIWVGTNGGLNKLDRESKQFTRYIHNPDDPQSLGHDVVFSILEDSSGEFWIGTKGGLDRYNPNTEQFIHYRRDTEDSASSRHDSVRSIQEDSSGTLWFGTSEGLCKFNPNRTQFTCYQHDAGDPKSLSNNTVIAVYVDQSDEIWVGTWGGGLNRFNWETEEFVRFQYQPNAQHSLSSNNIDGIYQDPHGMVWLSTDGGLNMFDSRGKPFFHYRTIPDDPNSLSNNEVRVLYVDQAGLIWVGTNGGGLSKFDRRTEKFTHYRHDSDEPTSLLSDAVWAIYEDREGQLWIGSYGSGLSKLTPDTEQFFHYHHDPDDPLSLSNNVVTAINEDQNGNFWIGTENGLNKLDGDTFIRYWHDPSNPQSISSDDIKIIYEDRSGELWIGTTNGINKYIPAEDTFTRYQHDPADPQSLAHSVVLSMHEDRTGNFWIASAGGLDKFDRENERFSHYSTKDGLSSDVVYGILEDEQGRLWLSSTNGLSRFDPRTDSFRNYDVSDGLQSNSFLYYSAYAQSENGEMYFGGTNGFNAFYPDQIVDNLTPPPVLITNFQLSNKPVPIGDDSVLEKSILETDELELSYLDNVFSFEFAALNYRAPERNRYKYKMEGFEDDWNEVDSTRRFITYTHLDPGDYVFRVIASNNDGIWNEEGASIKITITPPWWETTWLRIGMGILVIGLIVGGYRLRVRSIEARSRELEAEIAERTQELQAANQAKSIFLANMSHELRTPINAILGFARLLSRDENLAPQQQQRLAIINRSGEHLLEMISDILTLSRIEAGRVGMSTERFSLPNTIENVGGLFLSRAEGKGLHFNLEMAEDLPEYLLGDAGKLRQVLINLLDNAVKYTQEGGVDLHARTEPLADDPDRVMLRLEVEDSGTGIDPGQVEEIFDPFIQAQLRDQTQPGVGLGLSISQSLVNMMGGEIRVDSEVGRGSVFKVDIPMLLADEGEILPEEAQEPDIIGLKPGQTDWRILVVDDNRENLLLLTNLLTQVGFVLQDAGNGAEAVEKFQGWRPHFIWMDIRMPVMDGYEATRKIRALPGGNEVKIVAVTASVIEDPQEAVQAAGCDDVVLKPYREQEIFDVMARELGVEYLYRDGMDAPVQIDGKALSVEDLLDLPPELLQELSQTTLIMNREATLAVIERIDDQAPETGASLRALVENFQMGSVRKLLKEVESNNES